MEIYKDLAAAHEVELRYTLLFINKITKGSDMSKNQYSEEEVKSLLSKNKEKYRHYTVVGLPNIRATSGEQTIVFKEAE